MELAEEATATLVPLAAALSSRPAELVARVRLAAGRGWPAIGESPEGLRRLGVQTFLRDRQPVEVADPPPGLPAGLVDLGNRVETLPRLDRAVLVLLYVEQLTRAETAGIVDRPVAVVDTVLDRALLSLGADPYDLSAVLQTLSRRPVDPVDIQRAEVAASRRRRTRSGRRRLAVVAAVLLTVGLVLPGVLHRATPSVVWVRGHRDWVLSYRLVPPPGWDVEVRTVSADIETSELLRLGSGPGRCLITVGPVAVVDGNVAASGARSVRFDDHPGRIAATGDHADLSWELGGGSTADVSCSGVDDPAGFVTDLGHQMDFGAEPIALPYRLGALPAHFHVDQVTVRPQRGTTVVELWPDEVSQASVPISVVQSTGSASGFEVPTLDLLGTEVTTSCKLLEEVSVCAGVAAPGALDSPLEQTRTTRRLQVVTAGVVLAESGTDRSTWFDSRIALPRD